MSRTRYVALLLLVAVGYFIAARLGLLFTFVNASASPVWAPTGIAFAALLLGGLRFWPAVLIGALTANMFTTPFAPSLSIAIGNTLEAVVGAYVALHFAQGRLAFSRPGDAVRFILFAALGATLISAGVGVATLWLFGLAPWDLVPYIFLTWWLGDACGAIIVTPAVVSWSYDRDDRRPSWYSLAISYSALVGLAYILFISTTAQLTALIMAPLLWIAFRYGRRYASVGVILVVSIAIVGIRLGYGPYVVEDVNVAFLSLQIIFSTLAILTLMVASALAGQRRSEGELQRLYQDLEVRVEQRTKDLNKAQMRLSEVLGIADDAIIMIDKDQRIAVFNLGAESIFGWSASEVIGRPLDVLVPPEHRTSHQHFVESFTQGGDSSSRRMGEREQQLIGIRKSGERFPIEVSIAARTVDNDITIMAIVRDISDWVHHADVLRESEERYRQLVENSPEAIVVHEGDASGPILYANPAWGRLVGIEDVADAIGKSILEYVHPDYYAIVEARLLASPGSGDSVQFFRRDGSIRDIEIVTIPFAYHGEKAVQLVIHDVTARKVAERALAVAHQATIDAYDQTLATIVTVIDLYDEGTADHSRRVAAYTRRFAEYLGWTEPALTDIWRGALLHDVGKIGISEAILRKPGKLDPDEWAVMQTHPALAIQWLTGIDFLAASLSIPGSHHEAWDGHGYPEGLRGEEIPLTARMFAVVDTYDAIKSDRPYRKGQSSEVALDEIERAAGSRLDPAVARAFIEAHAAGVFDGLSD